MSKPSRRPRARRRAAPGLRVLLPDGAGVVAGALVTARVAGAAGLPVFLTYAAFCSFVHELGGREPARRVVEQLASVSDRPVFLNGPRRDGTPGTTTIVIPPADWGWTQERLNGYAGGYRDEMEAMFGQAADRLRVLLGKALDVLAAELDTAGWSEEKLKVALKLLDYGAPLLTSQVVQAGPEDAHGVLEAEAGHQNKVDLHRLLATSVGPAAVDELRREWAEKLAEVEATDGHEGATEGDAGAR